MGKHPWDTEEMHCKELCVLQLKFENAMLPLENRVAVATSPQCNVENCKFCLSTLYVGWGRG